MDIIPILTVTILAVTILTLILSVFAYLFYKLRERRNGNHRNNNGKVVSEAQQAPLQKEIHIIPQDQEVKPVEEPSVVEEPALSSVGSAAPSVPVSKEEETPPLFWRYTPQGYVPVSAKRKVGELKWQ